MTVSAVSQISSAVVERVGQKAASQGIASETFGSLVSDAGNGLASAIGNAEMASLAALSGQGSIRDVVDAVMSAEQMLHVATGIRDKIVSAYLEVSRMAI